MTTLDHPADAPALLPPPPPPPAPPKPEEEAKPKRPTTREGRRQAAALAAAKRSASGESKPKPAPSSTKAAPRRAPLETRLTDQLTTLGTIVAGAGGMFGPAYAADGVLIVEHAPNVAKALDKLAKDNPAVAAALERMLTAGAWSGVIGAVAPLVLGIAMNHGAIPAAVLDALGAAATSEPPADGIL